MLPHIPSMEPRCRAVNEESPAFRRGECQVIRESIDQMTDFYSDRVSKYNGIEQDILHAIEFSDGFSVDEKVALFDRLKVNRKARRENRDICRLLLAFMNGENVAKIYDSLQGRTYKPRQDESLFHDEEKDA